MTIFAPIDPASPLPSSPAFLTESADPNTQTTNVVKAVLKAKRILVLCGAGISVQAGIPDFRSADGLFQSLKRDNPREAISSGRELFDASVFNSEQTTTLFCQMIARLSELSSVAEPTPFHHLLRALDDRGKILRVLTQNIDALEGKLLSFGVPDPDSTDKRRNLTKSKPLTDLPLSGSPSSSRLPTPPPETPRCIPLHGTLQSVHCQTCTHSFPLDDHLATLKAGILPSCPECASMERTRQLVGKRARGVGKLRPSVVLYNEVHANGESVGEAVRKDLLGKGGRSGADLLLVVGTSLRVPGTKRIVREFSKAVHSRVSAKEAAAAAAKQTGLHSPSPSPRRTPATTTPGSSEPAPIKTIYLNLDFPVPTREWEGVFDVWVQGDAQSFAAIMKTEMDKEDEIRRKKKPVSSSSSSSAASSCSKRKLGQESSVESAANGSSSKRRKKTVVRTPLTPRASPPSATKLTIRIPARRPKPVVLITSRPPAGGNYPRSHVKTPTTTFAKLHTSPPLPLYSGSRRHTRSRTAAIRETAKVADDDDNDGESVLPAFGGVDAESELSELTDREDEDLVEGARTCTVPS